MPSVARLAGLTSTCPVTTDFPCAVRARFCAHRASNPTPSSVPLPKIAMPASSASSLSCSAASALPFTTRSERTSNRSARTRNRTSSRSTFFLSTRSISVTASARPCARSVRCPAFVMIRNGSSSSSDRIEGIGPEARNCTCAGGGLIRISGTISVEPDTSTRPDPSGAGISPVSTIKRCELSMIVAKPRVFSVSGRVFTTRAFASENS